MSKKSSIFARKSRSNNRSRHLTRSENRADREKEVVINASRVYHRAIEDTEESGIKEKSTIIMADIEKHNPTDFKIVSPLVSKLCQRVDTIVAPGARQLLSPHYLIITPFV